MPDQPTPAAEWSRRRFLTTAGLLAIGVAGVGAVAAGLEQAVVPSSVGGAPGPSGSPTATGPVLVAVASGSPGTSGLQSPGALDEASTSPGLGRRTFRTRPDLTPPVIGINVRTGGTSAGSIFFTPANGVGRDGPAIVDDQGEPIWLRPGSGRSVADFRVAEYRGEPVLTWWEGDNNNGIGAGELVIADRSYEVVKRLRGPNNADIDLHEFQVTPQGTAIYFADNAVPRTTPPAQTPASEMVMDCVIEEMDLESGAVLFSWHSADHIAVEESSVPAPTGAGQVHDYVHANSIDVDRDGNLLVSARNTSTIYKIDRTTGAILWRLGGTRSDFSMGPGRPSAGSTTRAGCPMGHSRCSTTRPPRGTRGASCCVSTSTR